MKRIVHSIISVLFLLTLLGGQFTVITHNHNTSLSSEVGKGLKASTLGDKCNICGVQNHNHFLSAEAEIVSFSSESSKTVCVYKQGYVGIKLVKSSSRSPPRA